MSDLENERWRRAAKKVQVRPFSCHHAVPRPASKNVKSSRARSGGGVPCPAACCTAVAS